MKKLTVKASIIAITSVLVISAASNLSNGSILNIKTVSASTEQKITVKLDGKPVSFPDVQPYVDENSRTLVPVRFVSEALGCKVNWEESNELVTITRDKVRILLKVGQNWAIVNNSVSDTKKEFDTKAVLTNDRTMVPLRFVSETLGVGVTWDEVNNTVILRSDGKVEVEETPTPTPEATPTPQTNNGWTVGDKPDLSKKVIQVGNGMTLDIALSDDTISQLMYLKGMAAVSYSGTKNNVIEVQYNEFHIDGSMDVAMLVDYTIDRKSVFFDVFRDSEETRARLKSAIQIMFPDYPEMQEQIYNQIIVYKQEGSYVGYNLNENYYILAKKNSTTWGRDGESFGVWCKVMKR